MAEICSGLFAFFWRGANNKLGYYLFVAARLVVGVGESAIIALGYGIVDDISPTQHKTIYMAVLVFAGAVGVALGYGLSGALLSITPRWQFIFFIIGGAILFASFCCYFIPLHGYDKSEPENTSPESLNSVETESTTLSKKKERTHTMLSAIPPLIKNPVYLNIVGYSIINGGIICMLAFWSPSYFQLRLRAFDLSATMRNVIANLGFGGIILSASIFGSTTGAVIVGKTGGVEGWRGIARALLWSTVFQLCALPLFYCSFIFDQVHWGVLFTLFFCGSFFLFAPASPFQVALNTYGVVSCMLTL
jgi:MFS family permease